MKASFFNFKVFVLPEGGIQEDTGSGQNQKGLLILFSAPKEEAPTLMNFLEKILKAIHYNLGQDTYTVNKTPGSLLSLPSLMKDHHFSHILIFGLDPAALGVLPAPEKYRPTEVEGKIWLRADSLSAIYQERQAGGKEMSIKLWNMLKHSF